MAHNNKAEENGSNAIENINDSLTMAGNRLAANKTLLFWLFGSIVGVALIILAWIWFYETPKNNESISEWQKVMMSQDNDTVKADNYKKVSDKFGSRPGGNLAALNAAQVYYRMGKDKQALECLEKFSTKEPVMKCQAETMKGDCYANLAQYDNALKAFDKALSIADGNPASAPVILWKEARVYEEQKNYKKAMECYQDIKKKYPDFSMGQTSVEFYIEKNKKRSEGK